MWTMWKPLAACLLLAASPGRAVPAAPAATTAPADARAILGAFTRVAQPGGIDVAHAVRIGGIDQWITVRGRDRDNPILLLLHGGPASPELFTRYLFEAPWTDYFTVVQWDQRGAGRTLALNDAATLAPTITAERIVADTIQLIDHLRRTYGKRRIVLVGHSWGSLVGMRVAIARPDLLHAYVGVGQMIDARRAERIGYDWAMARARAAGDTRATGELRAIGPYPGADGAIPLAKLMVQRKWTLHYGGLTWGRRDYAYFDNAKLLSPDYPAATVDAIDAGSRLSLPRLLPTMMRVDFTGVTRLGCPVILFAGRHDYTTPSQPVADWYARVAAPAKRLVWFERSAHMPFVEEPGRVLVHLVRDVRPFAERAGDGAPM